MERWLAPRLLLLLLLMQVLQQLTMVVAVVVAATVENATAIERLRLPVVMSRFPLCLSVSLSVCLYVCYTVSLPPLCLSISVALSPPSQSLLLYISLCHSSSPSIRKRASV